jgi:calcium-binding protein CML
MASETIPLSPTKIDAYESAMCAFYEEDDENQLHTLFNLFDINGDGAISRQELDTVIKSVSGESLNEEQIDAMFSAADLDQTGKISYEEFVIVMKRNKFGN